MKDNEKHFVISLERFKPHTFQAEKGEGLFMSHAHEYDELTLILDGEGYYSTQQQNMKVAAGDLIMIPSRLHHGFVCTEPWQGVSVHFYHERLPAYCQHIFHSLEQNPQRIRRAHLEEEDLRWAEISFYQLEKEWKSAQNNIDAMNLMRIALETTLLLFQRNRIMQPAARNVSDQAIVEEVLKEIHAGYYTQMTVSELAAKHFISESNLRKKFSDLTGVSPKQYIINLRLQEAQRLLQQTNKPVDSISTEVGFTSSSRFYDFFLKSFGMTPLEWRKQNQ
ncbi:HTH-type transcriptional activator RhaR [Paenibacillus sp. CECT 9249]|uniref:helix-turn-helix transcriptional regulator n=1 Tax=Paenibacillus sp. CECT 9249 TaxID=2845385 RepID=UPI001E5B8480|nr:AraC family transcriptional regulator [Paenibacillus sp. CECT 9249]CAH0117712.1 HTH-type transcriptional activator RhaR [Paenibacillus sp. CECT 9249]